MVVDERTHPIFLDEIDDVEAPPPKGGSSGRFFLILLGLLIALAILAALGLAWLRETDRRKEAEARIAAAQAETSGLESRATELQSEVDALRARLVAVRENLGAVRADSGKRREALRQARQVLAAVAPLRDAYDASEEGLGGTVDERKATSTIASAIARDLVQLSDYLADTDRSSISLRYLRAQARWLSDRIAALRRAQNVVSTELGEHAAGHEHVDDGFQALEKSIVGLRKEIERSLKR
jgi:chromosome segregation ATPase